MTDYQVDRGRWFSLSLMEQMGNIGSEVGRSIQAKRAGDQARFEAALTRALDLFNATAASVLRSKPFRAKEILRARDQYLELFFGDHPDMSDAPALERYFFQFALAARRSR